jgi:hypothetical protein
MLKRNEATPDMENRFLMVLCTVVGITLICGGTACVIAIWSPAPANPMVMEFFKTSNALFHTGVGAIIGLLGANTL